VRAVALSGAPAPVVGRLLDLFDTALHHTAAGELADVRHSLDLAPATLAQSLEMEAQKTSAYSFALPLQAGAVLAGADAGTIARLGDAGRAMGIAFQLADDLIDIGSEADETGKTPGTDLREGVPTLPVLMAQASTDPADARLLSLLGRPLTDDAEHAEALELMRSHPAMQQARDHVLGETARAKKLLEALDPGPVRTALESFADIVATRSS